MSIIRCPNCKSVLLKSEKALKCEKGHAFDFSKEGYINLLLPNKKKTLNPGDNKLMMNAREAFLSTGHYNFLIDYVESFINEKIENEMIEVLDLGCGSGYYTRNLLGKGNFKKTGIDLSKTGIAKASKKDKAATYIVGSVYDLPILDDSVGVVINIFSPCDLEEVTRILRSGGLFVKVIPGTNHMKEIATMIYESFKPHQSSIESDLTSNSKWQVINVKELEKRITLSDQPLHDLISMTPYLYKFKKGALEQLQEMSVTISFKVIIAQYADSV